MMACQFYLLPVLHTSMGGILVQVGNEEVLGEDIVWMFNKEGRTLVGVWCTGGGTRVGSSDSGTLVVSVSCLKLLFTQQLIQCVFMGQLRPLTN